MAIVDQRAFWLEVRDAREEIRVQLQKGDLPGQPQYNRRLAHRDDRDRIIDDNSVYIVSKRNRDRGTFEGHVVLTTVQLAGQRVIEGTHQIATKEQIDEFLFSQEVAVQEINQSKIKRIQEMNEAAVAAAAVGLRGMAAMNAAQTEPATK